jgi:hypothetical protein
MEQAEVEGKLSKALRKLYRNDATILEKDFNLNERSITFRLGMHLCEQFRDFDVDCEYNRMIKNNGYFTEGDYWAKTINLSIGPVSGEDGEARTVFPDIIVHKRKQQVNLVVIEVKIAWKNSKKDFDLKKLEAYKTCLNYQYAVYLEIGERKTVISFL